MQFRVSVHSSSGLVTPRGTFLHFRSSYLQQSPNYAEDQFASYLFSYFQQRPGCAADQPAACYIWYLLAAARICRGENSRIYVAVIPNSGPVMPGSKVLHSCSSCFQHRANSAEDQFYMFASVASNSSSIMPRNNSLNLFFVNIFISTRCLILPSSNSHDNNFIHL